MSTLVVVGYDEPYKAEEVRLKLRKLQSEYLLDLEDAVVAVKDEKGKVKLHHAVNLTADGAISGGFWGSLTGLIFLNAAAGAVSGAVPKHGTNKRRTRMNAHHHSVDRKAPGRYCPRPTVHRDNLTTPPGQSSSAGLAMVFTLKA
jgi:hypothetical protein